jgi:hypothetical protein
MKLMTKDTLQHQCSLLEGWNETRASYGVPGIKRMIRGLKRHQRGLTDAQSSENSLSPECGQCTRGK